MHKKPTEIPELLDHISRYLAPRELFACVQVSSLWHHAFIKSLWHTIDDTTYSWNNIILQCGEPVARIWLGDMDEQATGPDNNNDREWIRHLFRKYGHHIRDLTVHWSLVLEAASESCQGLTSLSLDIRVESKPVTLKETPQSQDEQLSNDEQQPFVFSAPLYPELFEESDYVQPEIYNEGTATLAVKQAYLERLWTMLQHYWHLTFGNPRLVRLSFAPKKVFPWGIRSESLLYKHLAKLTHLKELNGWALDNMTGVWRLLAVAPTIESLSPHCRRYLAPKPIPEANSMLRYLSVDVTVNLHELHALLTLFPGLIYLKLKKVSHNPNKFQSHHHDVQPWAATVGVNLLVLDAVLQDDSILRYLPGHVELTHYDSIFYGEMPRILAQHPTRFVTFKAHRTPWYLLEEREGREERDHANEVLSTCSRLRTFDCIERYIRADEMLRRPWVCMGLEWLSCRIVGIERLAGWEQWIVDRVMAPGYSDEVSVEEAAAVEKSRRCRTQQEGVYDRLASLTKLRHLDLGYENRFPLTYREAEWSGVGGNSDEYENLDGEHSVERVEGTTYVRYNEKPTFDSLELSLASGLDRLGALKDLEMIGFERINHRIGRPELEWMAKSWPKLNLMYGLDDDPMYGVEPDQTRAELKACFRQLRPDVAHGTLFVNRM